MAVFRCLFSYFSCCIGLKSKTKAFAVTFAEESFVFAKVVERYENSRSKEGRVLSSVNHGKRHLFRYAKLDALDRALKGATHTLRTNVFN